MNNVKMNEVKDEKGFKAFLRRHEDEIVNEVFKIGLYGFGIFVGCKMTTWSINAGLGTMFAENPELKKMFEETAKAIIEKEK